MRAERDAPTARRGNGPIYQVRLDDALQRECVETAPLVPAGVTLQPAAWRADLEGVLSGVPKFWNVRRKA